MSAQSDYHSIAEQLMDRLSDKTLETHPHFRIVPTKRKEDDPKLWKIDDRNEVGFILEDYNLKNESYGTNVEFKARVGANRFVSCGVAIEKKLDYKGFMVDVIVDGSHGGPMMQVERVSNVVVPLIGGEKGKSILLKIVNDVKKTSRCHQILFKMANETQLERVREGQQVYDFGNLLDLSVRVSSDNIVQTRLEEIKGYGLLPIDSSAPSESILFRDYYLSSTRIPHLKTGNKSIAELSTDFQIRSGRAIAPEIQTYVKNRIEKNGGRLYDFQNRAILAVNTELENERKPCLIIARTAAGKTEAFLIPVINWIIQQKTQDSSKGVRALFFYPTKALAADQLQRIVDFLHSVNKNTPNSPISVGVYHGDIEERLDLDIPLPLRCVLHEQEISQGKLRTGQVRLKSDRERKVLQCPRCGEKYPFVLADRFNVTLDLPDILICTPDVINYILMMDKTRHVFFGSRQDVKICNACKRIFHNEENVCDKCGANTVQITIAPRFCPQIILLDELHMFSSLFGGNVSNFLKRLSGTIRTYSTEKKPLQFIATSATIRNPAEFGQNFFGREVVVIETKKEEYDYSNSTSKEIIFAAPRAYRMIDSVSYSLYEILRSTNIRVLAFVNSLKLCGMLLDYTRQRLAADPITAKLTDQVDGHNSSYTRQERAEAEEKFNRGELRVLIATSTLEVGVDFKDLDGMLLYGMPHNFNSFLQRVGRAGRGNDAIIFNFLNPTDPIDLFYYRNAIRVGKDPTEFIEFPPFPDSNDMLATKHILCSLFDASRIFGLDLPNTLKSFRDDISQLNPKVMDYLKELWPQSKIDASVRSVRLTDLVVVSDNKLPESMIKKFNLTDLRKVDETIVVEFDEPTGFGNSRANGYHSDGRGNNRYARLGLSAEDRNILNQLKNR